MIRKYISLILALVLLCGMLPQTVLAASVKETEDAYLFATGKNVAFEDMRSAYIPNNPVSYQQPVNKQLEGKTVTRVGVPVLTLADYTKDCKTEVHLLSAADPSVVFATYPLVISANSYASNTVNEWIYFDLNILVDEGQMLAFGGADDTLSFGYADVNDKAKPGIAEVLSERGGCTIHMTTSPWDLNHSLLFDVVCGEGDENPFAGKYISIMGASTSTFGGISNHASYNSTIGVNAKYYPKDYLTHAYDTWWMKTVNALDLKLCVNNSWSGSCVTTRGGEVAAACMSRATQLHNDTLGIDPDIIVLMIGGNDALQSVTIGEYTGVADIYNGTDYIGDCTLFGQAYATMVHKTQARYPDADIFVCSMLNWKAGMEPYNAVVKQIADEFRVTYVDLYNGTAISPETKATYLHTDGIHPTEAGFAEMAECVTAALEASVHVHSFASEVTAPTCTEQGYTTYTCACGDSYVADFVDATGEHTYDGGICTGCGIKDYRDVTYVAFGDSITAGVDGNYKGDEPGRRMPNPYPKLVGQLLGCGDSYVADFVDATGEHTYDGGICTGCGIKDYRDVTYVAFGDSITAGVDGNYKGDEPGRRMPNPYPKLVGQLLGFGTVSNQGVSGGTLCADSGRTNMTERILNFHGEADVISVMLGVNDYAVRSPMGEIDSTDNKTIYGSLNLTCQHLTENYPDAFVFFMTPFKMRGCGNDRGAGYILSDVADAIKEVAAKYDIPVLDMYTYGRYEEEFNDTSLAYQDGIHPSQQHHIKYTAPMIAEFIGENYDGPKEEDSEETEGKLIYTRQNLTKGYCTVHGTVAASSVHSYFTMDAAGIESITITPPDAPAWNPRDIYYIVIVEEDGTVSCYGKLDKQEPTVIEMGGKVKGTVYFNAFYDDTPQYVYVKEAVVVPHEHAYETAITAPTCMEKGYTTYTCACGDSYTDGYTNPTGHIYSGVNCDRCDQPHPALDGHLQQLPENTCAGVNLWTALEPENAYFSYKGTEWLNLYYSVTFPVKPGDRLISNTYDNGGIQVNFFKADGSVKVVMSKEVYAEYTENGWITVPEGTIAVNTGQWTADAAGEIYLLDRPHSYTAAVIAPTCTEQGYTTHICRICGESFVDTYTEPLGHTPGEPVQENETETGYDAVVYCEICGTELSREQVVLYIPGDINGDGAVNNKDATRLFQYMTGWRVEVAEAALDVNGDGKVNNKDATRLFQYLSGWPVEIY